MPQAAAIEPESTPLLTHTLLGPKRGWCRQRSSEDAAAGSWIGKTDDGLGSGKGDGLGGDPEGPERKRERRGAHGAGH